MEIYKNDENNENDENRTGQVVEEYASAPEDFQRIHNKYYYLYRREDGNENVVNPDALPFCLNIVSSSIRGIPAEALCVCDTLTKVRVLQRGRRKDDDRISTEYHDPLVRAIVHGTLRHRFVS